MCVEYKLNNKASDIFPKSDGIAQALSNKC